MNPPNFNPPRVAELIGQKDKALARLLLGRSDAEKAREVAGLIEVWSNCLEQGYDPQHRTVWTCPCTQCMARKTA